MSSLDEFTALQIEDALGEDFQQYITTDGCLSHPPFNQRRTVTTTSTTFSCSSIEAFQTNFDWPIKELKADNWSSCTTQPISTPKGCPSLGNPISPTDPHQQINGNPVGAVKPNEKAVNPIYASKAIHGNKRASTETTKFPSFVRDHVFAERKRRDRLSQRFIALSAIVPDLKKMDKASVLGDAIKYLKQLQERVKTLEEQKTKHCMESVVFVKKLQLSAEDDTSSFNENLTNNSDEPLPEIEARVSDKNILIRIHCEKQRGLLVKTLAEIEKLHLTVVNSSVMPFGNSALNIPVMAKMDVEFCMTVKDLVKNLRSVFLQSSENEELA